MKTRLALIVVICAASLGAVLALLTAAALAAPVSPASTSWTDDFASPNLDGRWSWIREDVSRWSLTARSGFLRLTTNSTISGADNLLLQTAPLGDYDIQTRVLFTPTQDFQLAGLLIYQDDGNSLTLSRAFCDVPSVCVGNGIYFDHIQGGSLIGTNFAATTTVSSEAYLRVLRHANVYTGFVSTNGISWTVVGVHTLGFSPTQIGLKASNQAASDAEISADFDFFTLIDSSFRLYLPLVMK